MSKRGGRDSLDIGFVERDLGPVVRRVDNFTQRINPYPVDKIYSLSNQNYEHPNFIPRDKDLSAE